MKFISMSAFLLWTLVVRPSRFDDEPLVLGLGFQKYVVYIRDPVRHKARLYPETCPECIHFFFLPCAEMS